MYEYQFRNNIGFDFDIIDINPSGNIFLVATDGYYYRTWISPEEFCLSIQAYNFSAVPECGIDIFFNITLTIKNKQFVNIEAATKATQITVNNNLINIENAFPFKNYTLFDVSGSLLKQQLITNNYITININKFHQKMIILQLSDPNKSNFLTHKIVNL